MLCVFYCHLLAQLNNYISQHLSNQANNSEQFLTFSRVSFSYYGCDAFNALMLQDLDIKDLDSNDHTFGETREYFN